jgi:DNA polymerase-1
LGADYSQIEMRIMAHLSADPKLMSLFHEEVRDGKGDIYLKMAAQIFGKEANLVTIDERDRAKTVCLGDNFTPRCNCKVKFDGIRRYVRYGCDGNRTKARNRYCSGRQHKQKLFWDFQTCEAMDRESEIVSDFLNLIMRCRIDFITLHRMANQKYEVRTICGRQRCLQDIASGDPRVRATAERQAVNTIIQGSASDLIKLAMILTQRTIESTYQCHLKMKPRLLLTIHDELIYEVPTALYGRGSFGVNNEITDFAKLLQEVMEVKVKEVLQLQVPIVAKLTHGRSWGEMTQLELV